MTNELIKNLLEAGVHFGHQTRRWNPKMRKYIFGERGGIYIIDLEQTADYLTKAYDYVRDVAAKGGRVLFIGTKKQAQDVIEEEAQRAEMYFVRNRWLGGLLTNFETVKKSIAKLNEIERLENEGVFKKLSKKEIAMLNKQKERLLRDIGGIREMSDLPQVVFIVDPKKEDIAVKEATKLGLPIVGIVDTNCDPDFINYPIPGNDDAVKSIRFITRFLTDALIEGRKEFMGSQVQKEEKEEKEETVVTEEATA